MNLSPKPRIAVLGAGPIGLEAALYARTLGYPVTVYEADRVGHHLLDWGHVVLFTPWAQDVSPLGERRIRETGIARADRDPEACPTGEKLVRDYLTPLTLLPEMEGVVREGRRAAAIGREGMLKGQGQGDGSRAGVPFRILVESPEGESVEQADVVIDATGVYGQPNPLGRGGIPATGERSLAARIDSGLPDVEGRARARYEGLRVLVVGGGLSAATTVTALSRLPGTRVHWATLSGAPPIEEIASDPLPSRLALARAANRLALDPPPGFIHHSGTSVTSLLERGGGVEVRLLSPRGETAVLVDRVIAQTGFRPDSHLHRELQIHQCYASEGPMKLAAALLGGGSSDCMTQTGFGPDSLTSPESDFFLAGHKSYGRGSQFLLRIGLEQIRDIFRLVSSDPTLDLYAGDASRV